MQDPTRMVRVISPLSYLMKNWEGYARPVSQFLKSNWDPSSPPDRSHRRPIDRTKLLRRKPVFLDVGSNSVPERQAHYLRTCFKWDGCTETTWFGGYGWAGSVSFSPSFSSSFSLLPVPSGGSLKLTTPADLKKRLRCTKQE
jgi:hypothetical protein